MTVSLTPYYSVGRADISRINEIKVTATLDDILDAVCSHTGQSIEFVGRKTRKREIAQARYLYFHFAWIYTNISLSKIGEKVGGYDHTTVIHGRDLINDLALYNKSIANDVQLIHNKLNKFILCR
jgi:chromosomal replication initiator protein